MAGLDFIYKREATMNGFLCIDRTPFPFLYNTKNELLTIDHCYNKPNGFISMPMKDVYRVEMIDEGNLYLYWETLADREELEDCIRTFVKLVV